METEEKLHPAQRALDGRLKFLAGLPDGILHRRPGSLHDLVVMKRGTHVELVFRGGAAQEIEADMDFTRPLYLVDGFTQALTLGLLWRPDPARVFLIGYGGGRIPTILYHHLPRLVIDCAEIDPDVVEVARQYFAAPDDARVHVAVQDGREYLARCGRQPAYDVIMVDAFDGTGDTPARLATTEFYQLCRERLVEGGAATVNILTGDSRFDEKVKALKASFRNAYHVPVPSEGCCVLIGHDGEAIPREELVARARALQDRHGFLHPFVEHAERITPVAARPLSRPGGSQ